MAATIVGYALLSVALSRANAVAFVGMPMLALNFGAWAFALHLLF